MMLLLRPRFLLLYVFISMCLSPCLDAQQILPETLNRLKDATVFVKTSRGSGSGFLIKQESDHAFIATNHHVVITRSGRFSSLIKVVFNSGTKAEQTMKASVVAHDREKDLAILRVEGKNLPKPIDLTEPEISETLGVYIVGFPFGEALGSDEQQNPSLTISSGSISSLRKTKEGKLDSVQLDGDLNPGNSGGPIVTKDGKLVGVAVATLFGTQIAWAIPGAN